LLKYWKQILSTARALEQSLSRAEAGDSERRNEVTGTEYFFLSKYLKVNEAVIGNRVEEVNDLIKNVEEILKERCSLLLNESNSDQ
jgi:hypothetical protein